MDLNQSLPTGGPQSTSTFALPTRYTGAGLITILNAKFNLTARFARLCQRVWDSQRQAVAPFLNLVSIASYVST